MPAPVARDYSTYSSPSRHHDAYPLRGGGVSPASYDVARHARLPSARRQPLASVERSLIEDIEDRGVTQAWRAGADAVAAPPGPPPMCYSPQRRVGGAHALYISHVCDVCGGDKDVMAYCPVDGRRHMGNERGLTRFDAARHVLLQEERERAGLPRQPIPTDLAALGLDPSSSYGSAGAAAPGPARIEVGGYVVVKDEETVRLQCTMSNSPWHDHMAYYCGGGKVGRVVFHKAGCPATDVAFPSGESWLFPTAALQPYEVPSSLQDMERYPVDDFVQAEEQNDKFLLNLQAKVHQRSLAQQISNLQVEYIETYLATYKEENASRARLKVAFKEIAEIGLLQRDTANYLRYRQHVGYGPRAEKKPRQDPAPAGPAAPASGRTPWSVVGTTRDGHCIIAADDMDDFLELGEEFPPSHHHQHQHQHQPVVPAALRGKEALL